eukprot:6815635-Pyramimonas_sp.AAC.1
MSKPVNSNQHARMLRGKVPKAPFYNDYTFFLANYMYSAQVYSVQGAPLFGHPMQSSPRARARHGHPTSV